MSSSANTALDGPRPGTLLTPEDGRRLIQHYVNHYNTVRLHIVVPAGRKRSTMRAIASWRRRGIRGNCALNRRREIPTRSRTAVRILCSGF